jgi:HSP90 family molecular chaperone
MRTGAIFGPIHEISRHAIHTSEILEAAIDTIKEMQDSRTAIQKRLLDDLGETYREQAKDYAQFQLSLLKCLKLRSDSNQERLKNEINLVRNGCFGRVPRYDTCRLELTRSRPSTTSLARTTAS